MVESIYLFLIDYVRTILFHPILKGIELGFYILLWQIIGVFVMSVIGDLTEPLKVRLNLKVNYFVLFLGCLTGCFLSLYFLTGFEDKNVHDRSFRLIGIFGSVFLFFILILSVGIIVPIYSITMGVINFVIGVLPILAGLAVLMPILFFGGIFSIVGYVAGRFWEVIDCSKKKGKKNDGTWPF